MSKPLKIFITYSHTNTEEKDKLITCLAVMKRQGLISIWHDNEILGGDKWRDEIFSTNLPNSDILLYLVSAESLASKNCNKELAIALDQKIRIIPIILEDCDWKNDQLGEIQAFPEGVIPINECNPESKGWQSVVDGIRKVIKGMQSQSKSSPTITPEEIETLAFLAFHRGNFMMMLDQIDEALKDYSRTIELSPKDAAAYTNRGVAYGEKGEFDLAIKDYFSALKINPNLLMPIIISVTLMLKKTKLNVQSKTLIKRFNSNKTFPMPIITEAMLSVKETRLTMLSMTLPKP
ncbi:MAG: TIR domain-containing protein [Candidatus Poribacteria bacterium]|nr:TIR domain-containing protein [Candidatus Poribacteria bacterium]